MTSTEEVDTAVKATTFEINDLVSSNVYPSMYAGRVLAVTEDGVLAMGLPYAGATDPTVQLRPAHQWQRITDGSRDYVATRTHFGQVLATQMRQVTLWRESAQQRSAELATFRDQVRERMIQEAEDRGWCEEFDRILEEFGLDPRTHEYYVEVTITATQTISVPITARDEDEARDEINNYGMSDLEDYVSNTEWSWDSSDIEITDVTDAD